MANAFLRLLKSADADLLETWLSSKSIVHNGVPSGKNARTEFASALLLEAIGASSDAYVNAVTEAGRIDTLSKGQYDWAFARHAGDLDELSSAELTGLNRSLWTALHHPNTFEQIERLVSYNHFANTRTKHTRFKTLSNVSPELESDAIAAFEAAVQSVYRTHDFSGRHAETEPERIQDYDGKSIFLITVTLSQTPKSVARFDDSGEARDDALLLATTLHASYEVNIGEMYITASRGGFPVREKVAEAFAELILGVDEAPAILKSEKLDLRPLLNVSKLAPLEDVPFDDLDLIEVSLTHPSLEGTSMVLRNPDGLPADFLETLFGERASLTALKSVSLRLHFDHGNSKRSGLPAQMTVTFNQDGSTNLRGGQPIEQILRDRAPHLWNLKGRPSAD